MSSLLQDLYQLGQSQTPQRGIASAELEAIFAQGFAAVVEVQPRFCPYTDGLLPGTDKRLAAVVLNAEAGAVLASALSEGHYEECGDGHFEVWTSLPELGGRSFSHLANFPIVETSTPCPF